MNKPVEISPIWTPRLWLKDLATEARLNRKFYTHSLGCWLAAIQDRVPKGAREKGNRYGSMLLRLPLAKWAGLLLAVAAIPFWLWLTFGSKGDLRREYQVLEFATGMDSGNHWAVTDLIWGKAKHWWPVELGSPVGPDGQARYQVWVRADGSRETATKKEPGLVLAVISVRPVELHSWLVGRIFGGDVWKLWARFGWEIIGGVLGFWIAGRLIDWRRVVAAMTGSFRRGARLVGLDKWNRKSVGPFWMRKKIGMWLRVSANGGLARISTLSMTTHALLMAKTGAGKTVLAREILDQADANGWVVVCSDAKREFLKQYYREDRGDLAVDPGLDICPRWALDRECRDTNEGRGLASGVFPNRAGEIPFFQDFAEKGLAHVLANYNKENAPKQKLNDAVTTTNLAAWLRDPAKHIFPRTNGSGMKAGMNPKSGDQSAGAEGMIARAADSFGMMPGDEAKFELCIREWVDRLNRGEQPGWIFFPTGGTTEKAIKPAVTAMLNYIVLRLRDTSGMSEKRRQVVLLLDEVTTSFDRLEELEVALTNLRSFGVMVVVGVHNYFSLREMYGNNGSETILSQPGIQFVGKTDGKEAREYAAAVLGKQDVWRLSENFPATFHDKHRSLNRNRAIATEELVTGDEIQDLDPLNGFLREGGSVVRIRLSYRPSDRPMQNFEERIIPMTIDPDDDEVQGGVVNKEAVPADGGPDVTFEEVQPVVKQIVEAQIQAWKKTRLLLLIRKKQMAGPLVGAH